MEALFGVAAAVGLLGSSVLLNATLPLSSRYANWLAVSILAYAQIVLASEVLSELRQIGLAGFSIIHLTFLFVSVLVWRRAGRRDLVSLYTYPPGEFVSFIKRNWLLTTFIFILLACLVFISLPTSFTPGDAAKYHLPRAHYWIQNRSARHFYTDDFRQVEFPPNSSFLYMWQILVTGSYGGLHVLQWIAAMLAALGIAAISRTVGHGRAASIFAAALYLSLPGVVMQMSTPLNDLLTAFGGLSFIYFAVEGVRQMSIQGREMGPRSLCYAGIAFGVFIGTKLTALFLLPVLAGVVLVFLLARFRSVSRILALLGLYCVAGFLILGSYNYILNFMDYGQPIVSENGRALSFIEWQSKRSPQELESAQSPLGNVLRYAYQVMDWAVVKPIPGADTLYSINNEAYRYLDRILQLELEGVSEFDLQEFGLRHLRINQVGFGTLGYAGLLASPLVLAALVLRVVRTKGASVSVVLLTLGLGWLVIYSFLTPWTELVIRYFSLGMALLIAGLAPWLYTRKPIGLLWLVPIMCLAIWSTAVTLERVLEYADENRQLQPWQVDVLERSLPAEAHVAVAGQVEFVHFLKEFGGYRFEPVPRDEILDSVLSGDFDAALVIDPDEAFQPYRLPFEHDQTLLLKDPGKVLLSNLASYGVELVPRGNSTILWLRESGLIKRLGPDQVQIFVPTLGPVGLPSPLAMEIGFPVPVPKEESLRLICQGTEVELESSGSMLMGFVPVSAFMPDLPYQHCRLHISDRSFGEQIPSDTIEIRIYSTPANE